MRDFRKEAVGCRGNRWLQKTKIKNDREQQGVFPYICRETAVEPWSGFGAQGTHKLLIMLKCNSHQPSCLAVPAVRPATVSGASKKDLAPDQML